MRVRFTRIVDTPDGGSRFEDGSEELSPADFAPPAPPLGVSTVAGARSVQFIGGPPGWDSPPHPTPARQWLVVVAGAVLATTSDEVERVFGPGDVVLLEDVAGVGHRARVVSDGPWLAFVTQLA